MVTKIDFEVPENRRLKNAKTFQIIRERIERILIQGRVGRLESPVTQMNRSGQSH